jgi:hypothetical protein
VYHLRVGEGKGDIGGTHAVKEINQALEKMNLGAHKELEDDVSSTVAPSDKGFSATVVCYGCYSTAD